jgi:hypothetical protein
MTDGERDGAFPDESQQKIGEHPSAAPRAIAPSKRVTVKPPEPFNVQEIRPKMDWRDMGLTEEDWAEWEALPESPYESGDMIAGHVVPADQAVTHRLSHTACRAADPADQLAPEEVSGPELPRGTPAPAPRNITRSPLREKNYQLENTRELVRQMRAEGNRHQEICNRLGNHPRPPHAAWRDLPWPQAFRKHHRAVAKWLSTCM